MVNLEELREKILDTLIKRGSAVSCVANYVGVPVMDAIMETIAAELNNDKLEYTIVSTGVTDGYGDQLCKKVNKMIKKGWAPHGGVAAPVQQGVGLVQAMVRRKNE